MHAPQSDVQFAYRNSDFFAMHKDAVRIFLSLEPREQRFELTSRRIRVKHFPVEHFFPGFEAFVIESFEPYGTEFVLGGRDIKTGWMRVIQCDLDGATDDELGKYVTVDRVFPGLHPPQALNPYTEGAERTWMIESVTGSVHLVNLRTGAHQRVIDGSRNPDLRVCTYLHLEEYLRQEGEEEVPFTVVTASTVAWKEDLRMPNAGATTVSFWKDYESTIE